jgi:MerR family transcriptional regulator/heat shock protein HspR
MKRKTTASDSRSTYHISSVAQRFNIHPQTLRLYEREGLLKPSRSEGNTRLYTDDDLRQLELILALVRDLGINLAGVEVVLNMRHKIERIEAGVNELLAFVKQEFYSGREDEFERRRTGLVAVAPMKLVRIEKPAK